MQKVLIMIALQGNTASVAIDNCVENIMIALQGNTASVQSHAQVIFF